MAIAPRLPDALRGVTIQVYRDVLPGRTPAARRAALAAELKRWKALGCVGFAPHGFTLELPAHVPDLAKMAADARLACLPIFGLDSDDPGGKGRRILGVARLPGVAGVGIDAESKWENEGAAAEAANAVAMGKPLIDAPEPLVVVHQPWPVPGVHESRYPWEEFAVYATAWANQDYYNAWKSTYGAARYDVLAARFPAYWAAFDARVLAPAGRGGIERVTTVEGYGWRDIPHDCATCFVKSETIIVWSEPFPEPEVLEALAVRQALDAAVGLYVPDAAAPGGRGRWSGGDAVRRFQEKYNAQVGPSKRLKVDNAYGPKTAAALRGGLLRKAVARVARAFGLAA